MKDVTVSSSKSSRSTAYPKKRPSPHGIYKTRKQQQQQASSPNVPSAVACRSPHALKMQREQQRQRDQIVAHAAVTLCREAPQMEDEYRDEIQNYMYQMERYTMGSTSSMDQQPEIKWHMRPCLVEFLLELHFTFRLRPETLYLTLNVLDRYVSRRVVYIKHYQLVGCAALWIAAKFEDAKDRVPSVSELVHYCRNEYDESAFIQMEGHVLQTIQWSLGHPTAEAWLRIYCRSPRSEEMQVQHVARFLMEITLFYRAFIKFPASSIALGSLMLARFLCGKPRRVFEETEEAFDVVEALDLQLSKHVEDLSEILVKKYSYAFFSKAATLVVRFYIEGGHFVRAKSTVTPLTPSRTSMSAFGTPMSATTTASDLSDGLPQRAPVQSGPKRTRRPRQAPPQAEPGSPLLLHKMSSSPKAVQTFGKKKTATAVAHAREGKGLIRINGSPIQLVQPEILRFKVYESILVAGEDAFAPIDIRVRVKGGGHTSQVYAIRQAISKAVVAYYAKYVDAYSAIELKKKLVAYDRTLLIADPRRMEPKKFGGHGARARRQKSYR